MYETARSGSQGEFGRMVPLYPLPERQRCPRGHRLDVGGVSRSYSHLYARVSRICKICHDLDPRTAAWCELDPIQQVDTDHATDSGLELVTFPPVMRGGIGRIALHLDGHALGEVHAALCGPCQTAVITQVASERPRMGIGRVLVAAALARGSNFRWSTTHFDDSAAVRAFWAAVAPENLRLGVPERCSDMTDAGVPS